MNPTANAAATVTNPAARTAHPFADGGKFLYREEGEREQQADRW